MSAPVHSLPAPLLEQILGHAAIAWAMHTARHEAPELRVLLRAERVCRRWQQVLRAADAVWRRLVRHRYGTCPLVELAAARPLLLHLSRVERLAAARLSSALVAAAAAARPVHWPAFLDARLIDAQQLQLLQQPPPSAAAPGPAAAARAATLLALADQLFAAEGLAAGLAAALAATEAAPSAALALALPADLRGTRAAALVRVLRRAAPSAWTVRVPAARLLARLVALPGDAPLGGHVGAALELCLSDAAAQEASALAAAPQWEAAQLPAAAAGLALALELPSEVVWRSAAAAGVFGTRLLPALVGATEQLRAVQLVAARPAPAPATHVEYELALSLQYHRWHRTVRYRELRVLHHELVAVASAADARVLAGAFPGKASGWAWRGAAALQQRRVALEHYLALLFASPALLAAPPLARFFGFPPLVRVCSTGWQ